MRGTIIALLVVLLASCVSDPDNVPRRIDDPATGSFAIASIEYQAAPTVRVRAVHEITAGYALFVDYRAGDWLFADSAWANGRQLDYAVLERKLIGCSNGCKILESGVIRIPMARFKAYSINGLRFALIGRAGRFSVAVPGSIFGEVLTQMP